MNTQQSAQVSRYKIYSSHVSVSFHHGDKLGRALIDMGQFANMIMERCPRTYEKCTLKILEDGVIQGDKFDVDMFRTMDYGLKLVMIEDVDHITLKEFKRLTNGDTDFTLIEDQL